MPALAKAGGSLELKSLIAAWAIWWNLTLQWQKISWAWCRVPVIPTAWETETWALLGPGRQRLQWAKIVPLHSSLGDRIRFRLKKIKIKINNMSNFRPSKGKSNISLGERCRTHNPGENANAEYLRVSSGWIKPMLKTQRAWVSANEVSHIKCQYPWNTQGSGWQWTQDQVAVTKQYDSSKPEPRKWGTSHSQMSCLKQLPKHRWQKAKSKQKTANKTYLLELKIKWPTGY